MSKTCDIENQKEDENYLEEIKKDNSLKLRLQKKQTLIKNDTRIH
jgi:hypothetical protein